MTQDEIIEMVQEAGFSGSVAKMWAVYFETLIKLAAAKEREACAKMADEYATWGGSNFYDWFKRLAVAIRARGEQA
jgi:hypothetical protein